jgi:hypothetical protein
MRAPRRRSHAPPAWIRLRTVDLDGNDPGSAAPPARRGHDAVPSDYRAARQRQRPKQRVRRRNSIVSTTRNRTSDSAQTSPRSRTLQENAIRGEDEAAKVGTLQGRARTKSSRLRSVPRRPRYAVCRGIPCPIAHSAERGSQQMSAGGSPIPHGTSRKTTSLRARSCRPARAQPR